MSHHVLCSCLPDAPLGSYGCQCRLEYGLDRWKEAVLDACFVNWVEPTEGDPSKTLSALISWQMKCALDPAISEAAAKLLAKSDWHLVSEVEPPNDRELFAYHQECGLFYTARWNSDLKSFELPWEPTHWMERPANPE